MKTNTTNASLTSTRLVVLFAFLLLSVSGMFGQNLKAAPATISISNTLAVDDTSVAASATTTANDTMNFVSWFMGTKQTTHANSTEDTLGSKKQMINAGVAPNRLLIKAFLKKASNYASTVA